MENKSFHSPRLKRCASFVRRAWNEHSVAALHLLVIAAMIMSLLGGLSPNASTGYAATPTPGAKPLATPKIVPPPTGPYIMVAPNFNEGPVGANLFESVQLLNVGNIYGAEFHLKFNPSVVQVVDNDPGTPGIQIANGSFIVPSNPSAIIQSVDNTNGYVNWAATLLSPQTPVSGGGTLATVQFQAIASGYSGVGFDNPTPYQPAVKVADAQAAPVGMQAHMSGLLKVNPVSPWVEMSFIKLPPFTQMTLPVMYSGPQPPTYFDVNIGFDNTKIRVDSANAPNTTIDNPNGTVRLWGNPGALPSPTPTTTPGGAGFSVSGSTGVPGAPVTITGPGGFNLFTNTDTFGNYAFYAIPNGNYVVTPFLPPYVFTPLSRTVAIAGYNVTEVNFTAALAPTPTPGPSPSATPTFPGTPTPGPSPSATPTFPGTPTPGPSPSATPTFPGTPTPGPSPSATPTFPGSPTPGPSPSASPTFQGSPTPTPTGTPKVILTGISSTYSPSGGQVDLKINIGPAYAGQIFGFEVFVPGIPTPMFAVMPQGTALPVSQDLHYVFMPGPIIGPDYTVHFLDAQRNNLGNAISTFVPAGTPAAVRLNQALAKPQAAVPWQSATTNISNSTGASVFRPPYVHKDSSNNLHLVYSDNTSGNYEIFYSYQPYGGAWTAPVNISNNSGSSTDPRVRADAAGNVFAMWIDATVTAVNTLGLPAVYTGMKPAAGSWGVPINLVAGEGLGSCTGPNLAIYEGPGGTETFFVWQAVLPAGGNADVYYKRGLPGGAGWNALVNISSNTGNSTDPNLAKDNFNNLHLAWMDNTPGNNEIFYASLPLGSFWGAPVNISNTANGSGSPKINTDGSGAVRIAWEEDTGSAVMDIFMAHKPYGGIWGAPTNASNSPVNSIYESFAVTPGGVHAVWQEEVGAQSDIFYSTKPTGNPWTTPVNLSNSFNTSMHPRIASDFSGGLHVSYHDTTPGNYDVFYLYLPPGGSWTAPIPVSSNSGTSRFTKIVVDPSKVHILWEDNSTQNSFFDVFYASDVAPQPTPTPTPTGTPFATPTPGPSPTPWPSPTPIGSPTPPPGGLFYLGDITFTTIGWPGSGTPLNLTINSITPGQANVLNGFVRIFEASGQPQLVFHSLRTGNPEVFTMQDFPGAAQVNITNSPNSVDAVPHAAAFLGRVVFASDRTGTKNIWIINADGSGLPTQLTFGSLPSDQPNISSDGGKIVYSAIAPTGNDQIFIMDGMGLGQTRLTSNTATERAPHLSWNGDKIVFLSDRTGHNEIWVMDSNGSGQTQLTSTAAGVVNNHPSFTPDGRILFVSNRDTVGGAGNTQIYIMNGNGTLPTRITNNAFDDDHPRMRPDGQRIAFTSTRTANTDVYEVNPDGSGEVRMTTDPAVDAHPDWLMVQQPVVQPTPTPQPTYTPGGPTPTPGGPTPTPGGPTPTPSPTPAPTASPSPSPTPTPVPATKVQAGTAVVGSGGSIDVPITVKNFTATSGLGAFDITVTYNSSVINVTNVIGGDSPFSGSPTKNLTTPGQAIFNGFQGGQIPGPTGDIVVANLVVNGIGTPGQTSALTVVLKASSLADTDGVNVPAAPINGSVSIFGADFTATPVKGPAPLNVQFTDQTPGSPNSWSWDFGDNTGSSLQNPSHTYATGGNFNVSLTVSDGANSDTRIRTNYIQVIKSEFHGTPTSGTKPMTVVFHDDSTGTLSSWAWTFGDGATSTAQHPTKVYDNAGTYNVALTVTGPAGTSSLSKTAYITVTEIQHTPSLSQVIDPANSIVYLNININRIYNPSTQVDQQAAGGIGAYDLRLTYPGGTTGNAVNFMAVLGVAPFSSVTAGTVPSTSGTLNVNSFQTSSAPQPPLTLVQVAPRIIGSSLVSQNIVLTFNSLADVTAGASIPADGAKTFTVKRGDARQDGTIAISDALFIAQTLAGLREIGEGITLTHAVNGASTRLETTTAGEKLTIADALFIAQRLAGLRDESFN